MTFELSTLSVSFFLMKRIEEYGFRLVNRYDCFKGKQSLNDLAVSSLFTNTVSTLSARPKECISKGTTKQSLNDFIVIVYYCFVKQTTEYSEEESFKIS